MKPMQWLRSLCTAAVLVGVGACGGGGGGDNLATSTTTSQSVRYSLSAPAVAKQGSSVPIAFSATNVGSADVGLFLPVTITIYKDNSPIWYPPSDSTFGGATGRNETFYHPGDAYTYNVVWDQKDNGGTPVAPGTYTVKSSFSEDTEQISITIQ